MGEKTEEATPHKMQEARKKGQICKSKDLPSALVLVAGLAILSSQATTLGSTMQELTRGLFLTIERIASIDMAPELGLDLIQRSIKTTLLLTLPIIAGVFVLTLLVNLLFVGVLFTTHPLKPDINKLNPLPAVKNLFKVKTVLTLLLNIIKIVVSGILAYIIIKRYWVQIINSMDLEVYESLVLGGMILKDILIQVVFFFVLMGGLDFFIQKKSFAKEMKMSKDEIKREHKQQEGDPEIKHKRKELAHEMLEHAMAQNVQHADAVVTNPTHIACAIKYDDKNMDAPQMTAKGMRHTAEKIIAIAKKHNVPILRNISLARALSELQVGDSVPETLYDAVAEVLNFVYELNKTGKAPKAP